MSSSAARERQRGDPSGQGEVMGSGKVSMIASSGSPQQCQAGQTPEYADLSYWTLGAGDTVSLPDGTTSCPLPPLAADS